MADWSSYPPRAKTSIPRFEFETERRKVLAMRLTLASGAVVRLARER